MHSESKILGLAQKPMQHNPYLPDCGLGNTSLGLNSPNLAQVDVGPLLGMVFDLNPACLHPEFHKKESLPFLLPCLVTQ